MQYFSEQLGLFKEHLIWTQDDFSVNANIKTMEQWIIIINLSLNNKAIIISRHFRKNYNILWEHIVLPFQEGSLIFSLHLAHPLYWTGSLHIYPTKKLAPNVKFHSQNDKDTIVWNLLLSMPQKMTCIV